MTGAEAIEAAGGAGDDVAAGSIGVQITDRLGKRHDLKASAGACLLNVAKDEGGLDISAICGGSCACGTCHVYVDARWLEVLQAPSELETMVLEASMHLRPNSRLACQIELTEALNGLTLTLAPEE